MRNEVFPAVIDDNNFFGKWRFSRPAVFVALPVLGLLVAVLTRSQGYPICVNDEVNWWSVARQIQAGQLWPISGPLHFEITRWLADLLAFTHPQALALLGTLSVPAVIALCLLAYRMLQVPQPGLALAALFCSTYYWAPLLESRPQQWGQALVLFCIALAWRATRQASPGRWLALAAAMFLTAWVHILSFAVLLALFTMLGVLAYGLNLVRRKDILLVWLAALPAVLLLAWPGGPYAVMLQDIQVSHLLITPVELLGLLAAAGVADAALVWSLRRYGAWLKSLLTRSGDAVPRALLIALSVVVVLLLGLQSALLPDDSWYPYNGSALLFLLFQAGNLFFLYLLLAGLHYLRQEVVTGKHHEFWHLQVLLLISVGCVIFLALVASLILLDTNWMLRVINYSLILIAPLAALGLQGFRKPALLLCTYMVLGPLSIIAVLRPPEIFGCSAAGEMAYYPQALSPSLRLGAS
jgi:hypothetical protein